ncbi:putative protein serine/threonine kinase [Entophlyctis sp. JEL0112]|nr:putative protein serine/threonine kinase [Entophlyctis sp. JEL0112]
MSSAGTRRNSFVGTPYWMGTFPHIPEHVIDIVFLEAPEIITRSQYDFKVDIWSLGITIIELATGNPPFANQDPRKAMFLIPRSRPAQLEGDFSPQIKEFIALCLTEEPEQRPNAEDLLKTRFIKSAPAKGIHLIKDIVERHEKWKRVNEPLEQAHPIEQASNADDHENVTWSFDSFSSKHSGKRLNRDILASEKQNLQRSGQAFSSENLIPELPSRHENNSDFFNEEEKDQKASFKIRIIVSLTQFMVEKIRETSRNSGTNSTSLKSKFLSRNASGTIVARANPNLSPSATNVLVDPLANAKAVKERSKQVGMDFDIRKLNIRGFFSSATHAEISGQKSGENQNQSALNYTQLSNPPQIQQPPNVHSSIMEPARSMPDMRFANPHPSSSPKLASSNLQSSNAGLGQNVASSSSSLRFPGFRVPSLSRKSLNEGSSSGPRTPRTSDDKNQHSQQQQFPPQPQLHVATQYQHHQQQMQQQQQQQHQQQTQQQTQMGQQPLHSHAEQPPAAKNLQTQNRAEEAKPRSLEVPAEVPFSVFRSEDSRAVEISEGDSDDDSGPENRAVDVRPINFSMLKTPRLARKELAQRIDETINILNALETLFIDESD